jgi:N-acyl-D-amino-acid deacylase
MSLRNLVCTIALLVTTCGFAVAQQAPLTADVLLMHGRILDGTGNPWFLGDVAVKGDRIVFVGDSQRANVMARRTIDLRGLYLAPGFIDLHTHTAAGLSDPKRHENLSYLLQGVTTVATGNDGNSPWPIQQTLEKWERDGIGTNVALYVGFGTVRRQVIRSVSAGGQPPSAGDTPPARADAATENRSPTAAEIEQERALIRQGMREGAIGISTGLFYVPQSFSKTDEVVAVSQAAAELGGIYDSHLRDEDSYNIGVRAAVAEAIEIGRRDHMPIMISHIKCLGREAWGCSKDVVAMIGRARAEGINVVANQYPYEASGTALEAAVMPNWAMEGGRDKFLARLADPAQRKKMLNEIPALIAKRGGPETLVIVGYSADRSLQGKSLQEIAAMWNLPPNETVLRILEKGGTSVVSHNMTESDIAGFMRQDWTATGSDGELALPGSLVHPRGFGTFALKIQKYVNTDHVITLPFAVRAATSLPAQIAGFANRGLIRADYFADLIVFDPSRVNSPATYTNPSVYAEGMVDVMVNGQFAVENGQPTHALAGRPLRGPASGKQLSASAEPQR